MADRTKSYLDNYPRRLSPPENVLSRRRVVTSVATAPLLLPLVVPSALGQSTASIPAQSRAVSNLESTERIDFFTTAAHLSADRTTWILPIHARVYRPERSSVRKAVIAKALETAYGVVPDRGEQTIFDERINLLLGDNKSGRRIVVTLGGKDYALSETGADGHVTEALRIKDADLEPIQKNGVVSYEAKLDRRDPRIFQGKVLLIPPAGRSVISDIDDTVKVTYVTDRRRMMEATFLKPFEAIPGTASLFQTWASEGARFHFVSSSPWHLYAPLSAFLAEAGFPPATLTLKQIRLKDSSIQNIFADATLTKPPEIEKLLATWPGRRFVLVGDSGEKDPEIYAEILRRHPDQVDRIFVRAATRVRPDDERIQKAFEGIEPARWQLFVDPSELPRSLNR